MKAFFEGFFIAIGALIVALWLTVVAVNFYTERQQPEPLTQEDLAQACAESYQRIKDYGMTTREKYLEECLARTAYLLER